MTKDLTNHYFGKPNKEARQNDAGCLGSLLGGVIAFIVCAIITALMPSCTHTQYVTQEVPVVVHDTLSLTIVKHDSIHHRDSVFYHIYTKGDTVHDVKYVEHWNTEYKTLYDTLYELQYAPFEKVITKEVSVPAELSKQQRLLIRLGEWMIFTIGIFLIYVLCYFIGKRLEKKNGKASS